MVIDDEIASLIIIPVRRFRKNRKIISHIYKYDSLVSSVNHCSINSIRQLLHSRSLRFFHGISILRVRYRYSLINRGRYLDGDSLGAGILVLAVSRREEGGSCASISRALLNIPVKGHKSSFEASVE